MSGCLETEILQCVTVQALATFVVFPFAYLSVDVCSIHGTFDHLRTQLSPCLTQNRCT